MKLPIDTKKSKEALSSIAQNTTQLGKRVTSDVKNNVSAAIERSKNDAYLRKLKKYNPVFPEEYQSKSFHIPNMIMIVDDAVRRGIDVCEGAIGWRETTKAGMEILYLYDEAVPQSGLRFIPVASCDAVYYMDSFDHGRFIRVDCIFGKAHEEKLAELKHIAYCLGAKRCSVELCDTSISKQSVNRSAVVSEAYSSGTVSEQAEQCTENSNFDERKGRSVMVFQGNAKPRKPQLKWFAHDDNICRLIEMRCSNANSIQSERLELSGSAHSTMSKKTAYAIDCAISEIGGAKASTSMDSQAEQEINSKLVYCIEF